MVDEVPLEGVFGYVDGIWTHVWSVGPQPSFDEMNAHLFKFFIFNGKPNITVIIEFVDKLKE